MKWEEGHDEAVDQGNKDDTSYHKDDKHGVIINLTW